ncbi:MAG: antitoxin MazE-like protein [Geminicoccaceae bacterium]
MTSRRSRPTRDKVRAPRARLRRQALQPMQIHVPDIRRHRFLDTIS